MHGLQQLLNSFELELCSQSVTNLLLAGLAVTQWLPAWHEMPMAALSLDGYP